MPTRWSRASPHTWAAKARRADSRLAFEFFLKFASTSDWILFSPNGANVFSKNPFTPPAPVHVVVTVTLEPGPAGATVQLVTIWSWRLSR